MGPEDIVRSLAARPPVVDDGDFDCLMCEAPGCVQLFGHPELHDPDCPFRLAVEWVSEHPERGYLRAEFADGSPVGHGEFSKGEIPPFNPQYDLIGDAEQPQGPDTDSG